MAATAEKAPAAIRFEEDRIGRVAVPADALYGARTVRALQNLKFSSRTLGACPAYTRALAQVKIAAARANGAAGVVAPSLVDPIEEAAARVMSGELSEHFPVDLLGGGGSIGIHVNVNEVIANLANEVRGGRRGDYKPVGIADVGASQSTADVCHTALRLAVLAEWPALDTALAGVVTTLRTKAARFASIETMARTCLRDAMPVTLDVLFDGYARLFERRASEIKRVIDPLCAVSLGGTVIGTGAGAPAAYRDKVVRILAQVTGVRLVSRDGLNDALQNSDDVAAVSSQLRLLAEGMIKVAADLRLLASGPHGGFGELELPLVQEGSTFFAGKSNPVVPETAMQCGFQVLGCDRSVQAANEHAELYLNVFDGLAAVNVLDSIHMLTGAVGLLDSRCLRDVEPDAERCAALANLARR